SSRLPSIVGGVLFPCRNTACTDHRFQERLFKSSGLAQQSAKCISGVFKRKEHQMTKLLPSLALVLLASAGVAAPALATDFGSFDAGYELTRLQDQGINAVDVSEAPGDQLRATVRL